jgi:serine/threonine-protein kinase RsbW
VSRRGRALDHHRAPDPVRRVQTDQHDQEEELPVAGSHPDVELRIPADSAFLAVLRTATAGLAARLDFTLDDIEDLRIAVDEACAMVLPQAREGSDLTCAFTLGAGSLSVAVSAECDHPMQPSRDGFAWTVLAALTSSVQAEVTDDRLTITLSRNTAEPE